MLQQAIFIIVLLQGCWLIFDGIHVMVKGQYFGPPSPGPWSKLVQRVGIDPMTLGFPFVLLGGLWLIGGGMTLVGQDWAWNLALGVAVATLWYLPIGTVLSLTMIALLVYGRSTLLT